MKKMDPIFYLTILVGSASAILSASTYYQGKQKEIEADRKNDSLLQRTEDVRVLQKYILGQMETSTAQANKIISLQSQLQAASNEIISISGENFKYVTGAGYPIFYAKRKAFDIVVLGIKNNSNYPIYDINLIFADPIKAGTIWIGFSGSIGKKMTLTEFSNLNERIPAFNLAKNETNEFYSFQFPREGSNLDFLINIATRNGSYIAKIVVKNENGGFGYETEVADLNGKVLDTKKVLE